MAEKKFLVDINLSGNKVKGAGQGTESNDLVTLAQLDAVQAGLHWRPAVLAIQTDNTLDPSVVEGARYIIRDASNLHANFGIIADLENNDIVEHNGTSFDIAFNASDEGEGFATIVEDGDSMYIYDGTNWVLKSADQITADESTLTLSGGTEMSVATAGIGSDQLASNAVTAVKIAANAVTSAKIPDGEITTAKISALNITEALLANGAVTTGKIANGAVTTDQLGTDSVTAEKINSDVAGRGLAQDVDGSIRIADGYAATIGDGNTTDILVVHGLNTRDVIVQVYDVSSYETIECTVVRTDADGVTCSFATAPAIGAYRVVVKAAL